MLHTNFQGRRLTGSGDENYFSVCAIYEHGGHFGHVTLLISINFHSHSSISFHKNLVPNDPIVPEKNKF